MEDAQEFLLVFGELLRYKHFFDNVRITITHVYLDCLQLLLVFSSPEPKAHKVSL